MIAWSESACVRRTSFAFSFVFQLITWIGSLIGLGAPILLTDRSENEKRSRLGGSSFGMGRGLSVAVCVSWTLNFFGSIFYAGVYGPHPCAWFVSISYLGLYA